MGDYTIEKDPTRDAGLRIVMGPFTVYDETNVGWPHSRSGRGTRIARVPRPESGTTDEQPDQPASVGFRLQVRPDRLDEYRGAPRRRVAGDARRASALRLAAITRCSSTTTARCSVTSRRPAHSRDAVAAMQTEPVNERWQALMAPVLRRPATRRPTSRCGQLDEVFHLAVSSDDRSRRDDEETHADDNPSRRGSR